MAVAPVVMPKLGESIVEGTITRWHVKEGDSIKKDQVIVTVSTDKADTDVPSPVTGVVRRLLAAEQEVVAVEKPIAEVDTDAAAAKPAAAPAEAAPAAAPCRGAPHDAARAQPRPRARRRRERRAGERRARPRHPQGRRGGRPWARAPARVARPCARGARAGHAHAQAHARRGRGRRGRPRRARAARRVPGEALHPGAGRRGGPLQPPPADHRRPHGVFEADSPHVYTFAEIDMHKVARLRDAKKDAYKAEGVGLTFLAFIAAATARALRENPVLNARVLDDAYVKLRDVNLGVAVETPAGLIVPVVRNADDLTVKGLARASTASPARPATAPSPPTTSPGELHHQQPRHSRATSSAPRSSPSPTSASSAPARS
jgi:2-oxoglutarate dehydrogenase E2 component (dihydrolipoamide succinyltransferase)